MQEDDPRIDALRKLSELDEELFGPPSWPEDLEIDGHRLVCTSMACPEQYDVFNREGIKVGYLRLRHGKFRADVPDCGGETVYSSITKGDGTFAEDERMDELSKAVAAIREKS